MGQKIIKFSRLISRTIIKKLINGKAVGFHSFPDRSLQEGVKLKAPSLCAIFNRASYTKTYPSDLNIAKVPTMFKSGEKEDLNYRPISVIPALVRVFKKLSHDQMYDYLTNNNLLKHMDLVREPNCENCLDLILAAFPCEKVIIAPDTNYVTSAIRKFMLDMPSPGSFQNYSFLIRAQQGSEHVKPYG